MMWNYPQNIPYQFSLMFKLFSPHLVVKRFLLVLFNMLTQKKSMGVVVKSSRNAEVPIIHGNEFDQFNNPLHKQGQATS